MGLTTDHYGTHTQLSISIACDIFSAGQASWGTERDDHRFTVLCEYCEWDVNALPMLRHPTKEVRTMLFY